MPDYRRSWVRGGTYFFTVVTCRRQPILTSDISRYLLRRAWMDVKQRFPFTIDAICLLPDHFHCIWILPEDDANYSVRWKEIKRLFTKGYLEQVGSGDARNPSRVSRGEAATPTVPGQVWQRRFWEHTIRDEEDLNRHRDYIHYNPVKHGLTPSVSAWPWSSFQRYVKNGYYPIGWGEAVGKELTGMECGE